MSPSTRLSHADRRRASPLALRLLIGVAAGVLAVVACAPSPSPSPSVEPPVILTSPVSGPPSPLVFTGSMDEYIAAVASCLRDGGWNVKTDGVGGLSADITAEQRPAFMAAREACGETIGEPPPRAPASEAEIRARYAYLLDARDCLIELGYTIGAPATLDHFLDSYASGPWSPFSDLADQTTSPAEWDQANQACPQALGM